MEIFVINPKTGRPIRVGGPTYKTLKREGYEVSTLPRGSRKRPSRKLSFEEQPELSDTLLSKTLQLKKASPLDFEKLYVRAHEPSIRRKLKEQMKNKQKGRGSRTRGWGAAHPRRGPQRREVLKQCGEGCFLMPRDSSGKLVLKFPVCPKCFQGECSCEVSCAGVTSAKVRAAQWKYPHVYEAASLIEEKLNC